MTYSKGLFLNITSKNKKDWGKDIDFIKRLKGVSHLEIWLENIYLPKSDIESIKKELFNYKLIVHAPFINLSIISNHREINEASINILKITIEQSIKLNARLITIHAGAYPLTSDKEEIYELFAKNFKALLDYSKGRIPIAIENISRNERAQISFPVLTSELNKLNKFIPKINYTLDIGHCIQNDDNFSNFLVKNNNNHIKNIHLHNAIMGGRAHFGLNKSGDLKLDKLLELLSKIKYRGFLSLEIIDRENIKESWGLLNKDCYES